MKPHYHTNIVALFCVRGHSQKKDHFVTVCNIILYWCLPHPRAASQHERHDNNILTCTHRTTRKRWIHIGSKSRLVRPFIWFLSHAQKFPVFVAHIVCGKRELSACQSKSSPRTRVHFVCVCFSRLRATLLVEYNNSLINQNAPDWPFHFFHVCVFVFHRRRWHRVGWQVKSLFVLSPILRTCIPSSEYYYKVKAVYA